MMVVRFLRRVDRRGAALATLGVMDVGYGSALIFGRESLQFVVPTNHWGYIWVSVGLVVATGAFIRNDRWQIAVAVCLKAAWATAVSVHYLMGDGGGGLWGLTVFWAGFAVLTFIMSGWPSGPRLSP